MGLQRFDHVNIRTANLDGMVAWYGRVLGMKTGPRPEFNIPGAWLYLGDQALVHLVGVGAPPDSGDDLRLEHFAFSAKGMDAFLAILDAEAIAYTLDDVPGFPMVQVNFRDPDGNHIHVDFDKAERA